MVLEPGISEDHALLSEAENGKECPLGVSFVMEDYIYHFGDLTCLVRETIHIVYWYGARDTPGANTLRTDKVFIYKVAHSSRVQKRLNRMHLVSIGGADFYREDDRCSVSIESVGKKLFW